MTLQPAPPGALKGKRILVTGGGTGFGRALALAFAAEGAEVAVCGRRKAKLEETADLAGGGVLPYPADVSDPAQVVELVRQLHRRWPRLDGLVNNAGVLHEGPLADLDPERWREVLDSNVSGPFYLTLSALAMLRGGGRVVNVTSGLGFFPMEGYGAYCASKAALNMLSRCFALELEGSGVLVNVADPGVARTEMNRTARESPDSLVPVVRALLALPPGGPNGRFFKKSLAEIPV